MLFRMYLVTTVLLLQKDIFPNKIVRLYIFHCKLCYKKHDLTHFSEVSQHS